MKYLNLYNIIAVLWYSVMMITYMLTAHQHGSTVQRQGTTAPPTAPRWGPQAQLMCAGQSGKQARQWRHEGVSWLC